MDYKLFLFTHVRRKHSTETKRSHLQCTSQQYCNRTNKLFMFLSPSKEKMLGTGHLNQPNCLSNNHWVWLDLLFRRRRADRHLLVHKSSWIEMASNSLHLEPWTCLVPHICYCGRWGQNLQQQQSVNQQQHYHHAMTEFHQRGKFPRMTPPSKTGITSKSSTSLRTASAIRVGKIQHFIAKGLSSSKYEEDSESINLASTRGRKQAEV